ncbi:MAG TPA: hypothetical protein VGR87_10705 [Candidatus Limnocylindria bacterium]|jgi:hypothetical protein|nr:hypothetical protein [Candidatus Limnocylindria bacterium]
MKSFHPAKAFVVAAVIGLGLSGGLAAAAFIPGGSGPAAVAQLWDRTLGSVAFNGPGDKGSLFTAAASYIGITDAQLRTELGTDKSLADVAVAHGKTRDGLIQALVAAEQQSIASLVDRKGIGARPVPGFGRGPHGPSVTGDPKAAAATYLGLTAADLETNLHAGQTLAQIAGATAGKSRDGLIAYLVNDAKTKIAAGQAAGTITAAQATRLTAELQDRMTRLVDSNRAGGPGRRGH